MAADKITYNVQGITALANGSRELDAAKARIEQLLLRQGEHVAQGLRAQLAPSRGLGLMDRAAMPNDKKQVFIVVILALVIMALVFLILLHVIQIIY